MSLLDANAHSALLARITGEQSQPEQTTPSLETAPVQSEQSEQREPTSQEEHRRTEQQQTIPYDRFKRVNESKKEFQKKYEEQSKEIEKLRKELESKSSNQESDNDNWLEELLNGDAEEKPNKQLSSLEQRLQKFELKEAEKELGSMVKSAIQRNDDLDPELVESVIYQTIGENPNGDIDEAIERMREFVSYVNTKGFKKSPVTPALQANKVPPRPSMTSNKNYVEQANKPKNLSDAREALYNFLKNNKL